MPKYNFKGMFEDKSFSSETLRGDNPYVESPMFNATSLYYVKINAISQAAVMADIRRDLPALLVSMFNLVVEATPALIKLNRRNKIQIYFEELQRIQNIFESLAAATGHKRFELEKTIYRRIYLMRIEINGDLAPILIATKTELTPIGKLKEAFGLSPYEDLDSNEEEDNKPSNNGISESDTEVPKKRIRRHNRA